MLDKYKKHQFIDLAKQKRKVTWSEIEEFFGSDITESKDFDYLLYKLDEEGIKVINDSFDRSFSPEKNTESKKIIVVKVKKTPEQIKLENETIKLTQLLVFAKENNNRLSYSDIQSIITLERIITEDNKFKRTIEELQKNNIDIVDAEYDEDGTLIFHYSYDETIFESYINFDHPEMIILRKDVGQYNAQETEKFNKIFKEYLVKAHLEMGYNKSTICKTYGISDEALSDWIFAYVNNYDPVLPLKDGKYTFYPDGMKEKGKELYKEQNKSFEEIALILKVYPSTVKRWIKRLSETDIKNSIYENETYSSLSFTVTPNKISTELLATNIKNLKDELESCILNDLKSIFPSFYEVDMTKDDLDLPAPLILKNKYISISTNYITKELYRKILPYKETNILTEYTAVTPSSILEVLIFCNRLSEICKLQPCYRINNSDYNLENLLFLSEPFEVKLISCDTSKNGFRLLAVDEYKYLCRKLIHKNDDVQKFPCLENKFYDYFDHLISDSEYTLSVDYKKNLSFVFKSHPVLKPSDRPPILLLNKENSTDLYSYSEDIGVLQHITNKDFKFLICSTQQ